MYPLYYVLVTIASIIALVGTIVIARNVMKPENTTSAEDDAKQLKDDHNNSGSIPLLTTIYVITFAVTLILVWIFII
ncbi:hypothetical protein SAMN05192559_105224 [Halobacillus karajensis]|uniref:Uncharacterized protein n=1 Tax=Halobacillus karajensis TaxID=195088 RepID=A0A024P565_9BACI|nr:hypothetical protein [Halobacillus karajensis]CDQ20511.1 hypothetical protein BN982_02854 [Halobacillus karajensis]CDQ24020.1 hypothetical protein BN983_02283 [Halobacillus karajensis]CDQ27498.1 hypothetical protein BN981_01764 [Halobacillus karajensis]SEH90647.1 hypothetical protein SAMN05192559_105224 [Halobacillus karajensis]